MRKSEMFFKNFEYMSPSLLYWYWYDYDYDYLISGISSTTGVGAAPRGIAALGNPLCGRIFVLFPLVPWVPFCSCIFLGISIPFGLWIHQRFRLTAIFYVGILGILGGFLFSPEVFCPGLEVLIGDLIITPSPFEEIIDRGCFTRIRVLRGVQFQQSLSQSNILSDFV